MTIAIITIAAVLTLITSHAAALWIGYGRGLRDRRRIMGMRLDVRRDGPNGGPQGGPHR